MSKTNRPNSSMNKMCFIYNDILQTQQLIFSIRSHKLQTIYKTNVANTVSDNICDDEEESAKAHR